MGAVSGLVVFVGGVITFLVQLTVDLVCLGLLLPALVAPWRTVYVVESLTQVTSRTKYREQAILQFLALVVDAITFPMALVVVCTLWRVRALFSGMTGISANRTICYSWGKRGKIAMEFFILVGDCLTLPPTVITLLSGIRTRKLIREWHTRRAQLSSSHDEYIVEMRTAVWEQFLLLLLDLTYIPLGLIVFVSWRNGRLRHSLQQNWTKKRAEIIIVHFFKLLVDLPFACLALVIIGTLWRLVPYWKDLKRNNYQGVRKRTAVHFFLLFRDLGVFVLLLFNIGVLYRLPGLIATYMKNRKVPPPGPPVVHLRDLYPQFQAHGMTIRIEGTKPAAFTFSRAQLFVTGDDFFREVKDHFGGAVGFVLTSMLPMEMVPSIMDPGDFPPGEEEFSTTLRFATDVKAKAASQERLPDNLIALGDTPFTISASHDNQAFAPMLLTYRLSMRTLVRCAQEGTALPNADEKEGDGEKEEVPVVPPPKHPQQSTYLDVLMTAVLEQTLLVFTDVLALLGILRILLLSPWRIRLLFVRLFESEIHAQQRELVLGLQELQRFVKRRDETDAQSEYVLHTLLKKSAPKPATLPCLTTSDNVLSLMKKLSDQDPILREKLDCLRETEKEWVASNLTRFDDPDMEYTADERVRSYAELAAYRVDMESFWAHCSTKHRDWTTKKGIIFNEVKEATLDSLGTFAGLLVFALFYRAPQLFKELRKGVIPWREACFQQVAEIGLDIVYFFMAMTVIVMIFHAPDMILKAFDAIYVDRSIDDARDVVSKYFRRVVGDFWRLISFFTAWRTYKIILAILVWGLFTPMEMFLQMFSSVFSWKCARRLVSVTLWIVVLGYPFLFTFHLASEVHSNSALGGLLGGFIALLALIIAFVVLHTRSDRSLFTFQAPVYDVHWNFPNANALLNIILETYQLCAFSLVLDIPYEVHSEFSDATRPSLIDFGVDQWKLSFWLAFAAVAAWFFLSSTPVVTEDMFSFKEKGEISGSGLWKVLTSFLATTVFLSICTTMFRTLNCSETNGEFFLDQKPDVRCFTSDEHKPLAVLAMLALAFYIPTATMMGVRYLEEENPKLDVRFVAPYILAVNGLKMVLASVSVFYVDHEYVSTSVSLGGNFILALFTFSFPRVFGTRPCSIKSAWVLRGSGFLLASWVALVSLIGLSLDDEDSWIPFAFLAGGAAVILLGAFVEICRRDTSARGPRLQKKEYKTILHELVTLERSLVEKDLLLVSRPAARRRRWRRKVLRFRSVPVPGCSRCREETGQLAQLLLLLEKGIRFDALSREFLAQRETWCTRVAQCRHPLGVLCEAETIKGALLHHTFVENPNIHHLMEREREREEKKKEEEEEEKMQEKIETHRPSGRDFDYTDLDEQVEMAMVPVSRRYSLSDLDQEDNTPAAGAWVAFEDDSHSEGDEDAWPIN